MRALVVLCVTPSVLSLSVFRWFPEIPFTNPREVWTWVRTGSLDCLRFRNSYPQNRTKHTPTAVQLILLSYSYSYCYDISSSKGIYSRFKSFFTLSQLEKIVFPQLILFSYSSLFFFLQPLFLPILYLFSFLSLPLFFPYTFIHFYLFPGELRNIFFQIYTPASLLAC